MRTQLCALSFVLLLAGQRIASAQTDEIQVYDGEIAEKGIFNLTWHNNFAQIGSKTPAFAGGLVNNHNLNGVTEWAYGVTDWFEAGLYLPLYSGLGRTRAVDQWRKDQAPVYGSSR